jgi:hypothetical protein
MDPKTFWQLLADVSNIGEFVVGIDTRGVEINLAGKFQVAYDGFEMVLEKQDCKDHFHVAAEQIQAFHFGYFRVTTGHDEPCIELINMEGQVALRLFYYPYESGLLNPLWEEFVQRHKNAEELLTGQW